jgi:hypothetical protein
MMIQLLASVLWAATSVKRRKLKLKGKFERSFSGSSFKRLDPGAFNVGLIG